MSAEFIDLLLRMEDHDVVPTCLSAERHMPQDFLLHYLGCEQYFQREEYLGSLSDEQTKLIEAKLHRIQYVRAALASDRDDGRQYVQNLTNSMRRWRGTKDFQEGIDRIRELRTMHFALNGNAQREVETSNRRRPGGYNPDVDTNAYLMRFKDGRVIKTIDDPRYIEQYPCHRISVQHLIRNEQENNPLAFPNDTINYLHLPANNMQVSLHLSARYLECST